MSEENQEERTFNIGNYLGLWMIKPEWLEAAYQANVGRLKAETTFCAATRYREYEIQNNIAILNVEGSLMKARSCWGGTSTIELRQQIREASRSKDVQAIVLHIDSPGGHVAGTQELAAEVKAANKIKPVYAQIEDLGASAAYWIASQAREIYANEPAEIGSIGTVAVVHDTSKMYEEAGIKVHVISTGEHKGSFIDGTEVTDAQIQDLQDRVNSINQFFLKGVSSGRNMEMDKLNKIADGRVFLATKAKSLGLIDKVQSFDKTMAQISASLTQKRVGRKKMENKIRLETMINAEPSK